MIHTDAIEIITFIAALCGLVFSVYATTISFRTWRAIIGDGGRQDLRGVAARRLFLGTSHCLKQLMISIGTGLTIFMTFGYQQATVRTMTLMFVTLQLLVHSLYDHWEQRIVPRWDGSDRRASQQPTTAPVVPPTVTTTTTTTTIAEPPEK